MWINFDAIKAVKREDLEEQMSLFKKTNWSSSMISSTSYNPETGKMDVTFTNGASYTYSQIHVDEYVAFCMAESQGKYFNVNLKNKPFVRNDSEKN